jgi:TPP-dependent pyruvate/acetoin dehydrogenase alpha subunit
VGTKPDLTQLVKKSRKIQLQIAEQINRNVYKIPVHLALGHETVSTSIVAASAPGDIFTFTHRNIHFHIALGANYDSLDSEYRLKENGLAGGRLGSMNLTNPSSGNLYTSNILANNLAIANGIALSIKNKNQKTVAWAVTGDGAIEEGVFYEALLIAASLNLPVVFVIENNRWSLGTEINERRIEISLEKIAQSFDLQYHHFSNNNVSEYSEAIKKIRDNVVLSQKPVLMEFQVTTLGGYFVEESNGKRYINYHAGGLKIEPDQNGIFSNDNTDPVYLENSQE